MKTVIAGCRDFENYLLLKEMVDKFRTTNMISEVVSGGARGADAMGERYAIEFNLPLKIYPADWNKHGRAAGPIRNQHMAEYADQLIAVWDGQSKGTKNMIENMNKLNKPVYVIWVGVLEGDGGIS